MKDFETVRLWDAYHPLLTNNQQEITDLYFNCDLSLGEIAERKGVSRQSVSDVIKKSTAQLHHFEEKLHLASMQKANERAITLLGELLLLYPAAADRVETILDVLSSEGE